MLPKLRSLPIAGNRVSLGNRGCQDYSPGSDERSSSMLPRLTSLPIAGNRGVLGNRGVKIPRPFDLTQGGGPDISGAIRYIPSPLGGS